MKMVEDRAEADHEVEGEQIIPEAEVTTGEIAEVSKEGTKEVQSVQQRDIKDRQTSTITRVIPTHSQQR